MVIYANKFFEVQEYLSITEHLYSPAPLLISKAFYDSLPADLQKIVWEAAEEAKVYQYQACDDQNSFLLDSLAKEGMVINTPNKARSSKPRKPSIPST